MEAYKRSTPIQRALCPIRSRNLWFDDREGEIIERGTHDELYQKKGHYFNMVQAQDTANIGLYS